MIVRSETNNLCALVARTGRFVPSVVGSGPRDLDFSALSPESRDAYQRAFSGRLRPMISPPIAYARQMLAALAPLLAAQNRAPVIGMPKPRKACPAFSVYVSKRSSFHAAVDLLRDTLRW